MWFNWNDSAGPGDEALIAVHSSDPAYLEATFCDGQPPAPSNTCAVGPGCNTWYWRAVGSLAAPSCPSGMAHFAMAFHYMLARDAVLDNCQPTNPADIITLDLRGPDLTCIGR